MPSGFARRWLVPMPIMSKVSASAAHQVSRPFAGLDACRLARASGE